MGANLAVVSTYVDVAAAQIGKAIRYDESWLGRVSGDDVARLSQASAHLQLALTRILSRQSIHLPAKVDELADLALQTELDSQLPAPEDGIEREGPIRAPLRLA